MAGELDRVIRQDDFAARFGVTIAMLDLYAKIGLITPMRLNDHIGYSPRCALHMEIVQVGKRLGYSLAEIKILIDRHE